MESANQTSAWHAFRTLFIILRLHVPQVSKRSPLFAAERFITLTKLDAADNKPAKAASTSAGQYSQLHVSRLFDSPERGFPSSERCVS